MRQLPLSYYRIWPIISLGGKSLLSEKRWPSFNLCKLACCMPQTGTMITFGGLSREYGDSQAREDSDYDVIGN